MVLGTQLYSIANEVPTEQQMSGEDSIYRSGRLNRCRAVHN
jgi:hypothetical protein